MKPSCPLEEVRKEPPNIPQKRAFTFYAWQLLEERQRQDLRVSCDLAMGHLLVLLVRKYFVRNHLGEQQASGSSPL